MGLNEALLINCLVVSSLLTYEYFKLSQHGLFHWLSAGFWVWGAILFYVVVAPLGQYYWGQTFYIETRLAATEGVPRLLWITLCITVGTYVFFVAYFKSRPAEVRLGLPQDRWPAGTSIIMALSLIGAVYTLIQFRGFMGMEEARKFEDFRGFTGDVIGYQFVGHYLALFPISLLIFRKSTRYLGYALAVVFIVGRLDDKWNRTSNINLLFSISMISVVLSQRRWPFTHWLVIILLITVVYEARGHITMEQFIASGRFTSEGVTQRVKKSPSYSMLQTLWLQSYITDKSYYNYGLPLVNDLLFGYLPRKYFPWKSDIIESIIPYKAKSNEDAYDDMMHGSKSMVFGSLYECGGLVGIIVGMLLLGFLARKMDGLISTRSPMVLRILGIVWMGEIWMIFGSSLMWGAQELFISGLPCLGLVIVNKIFPPGRTKTAS
jgi:hypothetical protein